MIKEIGFIKAVQTNKIPSPTRQDFSLENWDEGYFKYKEGTKEEERLYNTGKIIFNYLSSIRDVISPLTLWSLPTPNLFRFIVGIVNQSFFYIDRMHKKSIQPGEFVLSDDMIQLKLSEIDPGAPSLNLVDLIESAVEGASSCIEYALKRGPQMGMGYRDEQYCTDLRFAINGAILYGYFEEMWFKAVWLGYYFDTGQSPYLFTFSEPYFASLWTVSKHRRDRLHVESHHHLMNIWKRNPSLREKFSLTQPLIVSEIVRDGKKVNFKLAPFPIDTEMPPDAFVYTGLISEIYLESFWDVTFPTEHELSLRKLLNVWTVLASIGRILFQADHQNMKIASLQAAFGFAPKFKKADLIDVLSKATNMTRKICEKALDRFIFQGNFNDDIWLRPLIPLDKDKLLFVIPAVTVPNLLRSIEKWMKVEQMRLDERGSSFEEEIRTSINDAIKESKKLRNAGIVVGRNIYTVDIQAEQIDIIFWIQNILVVGEIKCNIYPVTPIDIYNYIADLKKGALQIKRKSAFIRKNFIELLSSGQIPEQSYFNVVSMEILPIVISNLPLLVGMSFEDVPIVDQLIINQYLKYGERGLFYVADKNGFSPPKKIVSFYENDADAMTKIAQYLHAPPQITDLFSWIDIEYKTIKIRDEIIQVAEPVIKVPDIKKEAFEH
jgi:hypothetical protein